MRHLVQSPTSHLRANFVRMCVNIHPRSNGAQLRLHFLGIVDLLVCDWQDPHLRRSQPDWEVTSKMLDHESHETLNGSKDRSVNHDRTMLRSV